MTSKEDTKSGKFQASLRRMFVWLDQDYQLEGMKEAIAFVEQQYHGTLLTWAMKFFRHPEIQNFMTSRDVKMIYPLYTRLYEGEFDEVMPDIWSTLNARSKLPMPSREREEEILKKFQHKAPERFWRYMSLFQELTQ